MCTDNVLACQVHVYILCRYVVCTVQVCCMHCAGRLCVWVIVTVLDEAKLLLQGGMVGVRKLIACGNSIFHLHSNLTTLHISNSPCLL